MGQLLLHGGEAVRDRDEAARALVLERPDGALDHGQTAVLADGAEALVDPAAAAPACESAGHELFSVIRHQMTSQSPVSSKRRATG
jgi:hypothetical protein